MKSSLMAVCTSIVVGSIVQAQAPQVPKPGPEHKKLQAFATLEHLLLMYLYSNAPRHIGDFARIVTETNVDLDKVVRFLKAVHPEMVRTFRERVRSAKQPPPPPRPRSR